MRDASGEPQPGLFGTIPSQPLRWLTDETLFSLCSRHHRLSLRTRASHTSQVLFGHPQGGRAHDLPDRLSAFSTLSSDELGGARAIALRRTVLAYYLPYQPASMARSAVDAVAGPAIGSLKYRLGLLTSRFRAHHPLKACRLCMLEDLETSYVGYWHQSHQYPGVWLCPRHGCVLDVSQMKATGVARFQWLLPDQAELVPAFAPSCLDEGLQVRLRLLADAACGLATLPWGFHFEPAHLVATHRRQLQRIGLASTAGRLDHRRASESLADFFTPLQRVPELAPLSPRGTPTATELGCLRDPNRVRTHPLRQLCLTVWLHGSWEAFIDAYRQEVTGRLGAPRAEAPPKNGRLAPTAALDSRRAAFVDLMRQVDCSITSAAKRTGIDVQTGQAWAAAAGIACIRRPKTLKPALRKALIRLLKAGADKSSVAQRLGITLQAITRVLRTEVGLREEWIAARTGRRQASERRRLQALLAEHPQSGAKAIRWQLPATYAWLYRHDRAWLQEQLAKLPSAVRGNHARVDWDRRDVELCGAVRKTCAALLSEAPGRRVLLWRIYQRLPDLKAKLARLERLPLTRAAIERALAYRPSDPGETPLF